MTRGQIAVCLVTLLVFYAGTVAGQSAPDRRPPGEPVVQRVPLRYQVIARAPRLNRKLIGEVTESVQGVPAQPVDSMVYDGDGSVPIEGLAIMEIDPTNGRGMIRARWTDRNGDWTLVQTYFHHPEHLSGVRIGPSRGEVRELLNLGTVPNVYLHGDTRAGAPILPTVFSYLATWGFCEVTLSGEPFENPYGLPGPDRWHLHGMLTEGVRGEDGTVRAEGGEIYDPTRHKNKGQVDPDDLELHLEFQDERFPLTENKPPLFAFQYHLVFEDVVIRISDSQRPLDLDDWTEPTDSNSGE